MRTKIKYRLTALVLAAATILGLGVPAQAASIEDGSKTCTVKAAPSTGYSHLTTTAGTTLGATGYTYTTNDGLTGPAFCIDFGLSNPSGTKALPIKGKYTSAPATAGAFASGYPQLDLQTFFGLYLADNPILSGLTEPEYRSATQLAVWATLGQLGIDGTPFTGGREQIAQPAGDVAKMRIFRAAQLIANNAATWDRVYQTGMYIRLEDNKLGGNETIPPNMTLEFAAQNGRYGIRYEVINGRSYYTKEYMFASATSTYYQGYTMDLWATGAPDGTMFTDLNNVELAGASWHGTATWRLPVERHSTNLNSNGYEYSGRAKLCVPVNGAPPSGEITLHCAALIMQYEIYVAENSTKKEQSYIIADPSKGSMEADAVLSWGGEETEYGSLEIIKVGGGGSPLAEATFTLTGTDGSSRTGTTDSNGIIKWTRLNPNITYTLTETVPPPGYGKVEPMTLTVRAGETVYWTVKDDPQHTLTVRKIDRQDGRSLQGAVICFEQIDGSLKTTGTTDQAGYIQFNAGELPVGSYRVYELAAPEGYELDPTIQTVHWDGKQDMTLTFRNTRKPTIVISKVEGGTLYSLPDATFEVYKDGKLVTTVTTDANGLAYVSGVTSGYWEIKETVAPPGHILDGTIHKVFIEPYDPATEDDPRVTVKNDALPGLRIIKYNRLDHSLMEGVTFEIWRDGESLGRFETNENGEVLLYDVQPGTYRAAEVDTGSPGLILDTTPQEVELRAGNGIKELVFFNDTKPGFRLIKTSADGTPLDGVTFRIARVEDGGRYLDRTTQNGGEIFVEDLEPGMWSVTETATLPNHILDKTEYHVELSPGHVAELRLKNDKKPLLTLSKTDADSGSPIPNTVFTVEALDGTYRDDWKTGADGKVSQIVEPGVYEVTEKSVPAPYYLPDKDADRTQTITLSPNDEKTLVFRNRKAPEVTIVKENSITSEPIEGAKFHVVYTSSGEAAEAPATIDYGYLFTDANGEIRLHEQGKRMYPGELEITEVEPADGFQLKEPLTQKVIVHGNESKTVRFLNTPLSALVVWKYDSVTSAPVEGAIFQVRYMSGASGSGGTVIGTYKTGPGGSFTVNRLKAGAYLVEELASDGNHVMDTAPQTAYISGKEQDVVQLYFGNSPRGAILIKKIDSVSHEPLSDVEFFITDSHGTMLGDASGKFVTDSAGTILISNLDPGTTVVARETRAKPNFILDDVPQTATIKAGQTVTLEFRNQPKGAVTLYKFSSVDRKTPLEGVGFKITYADGRVVDNIGGKLSSNGIYYTDSEGQINISGVTGTLIFTEVSSIPGYLIDENRKSQTVVVNPDDHQSVYFYNIPENTLIIEKYLETESGNEPLKGVMFQVTDSSGAVVGNSNGEYISGEDGRVVIAGVAPGTTMNVREIKVPEGVVLDDETKSIKISDDGANILRFYNKRTGYLVIRKLDKISRKPLSGVEFELSYADGSYVDDNFGHLSSKGRFKTNDAGEIRVPVVGTVVVKEVKTLPTHVIDQATQIQTVTVNPADTQYITVYNEPLCSLTLRKLDSVTGKPVPNTEFTLKDGDGNILGRYTTGKDGTVTVTGLMPNSTVVVVESKVPSNYVLDPTPHTIIVRNGSNSVSSGGTGNGGIGSNGGNDLTVENIPKTTLTIEKYLATDTGNIPLKGVTFLVTDSSGQVVGPNNGEYVTDRNGRIVIHNLEPGTVITAKELRVPDGVVLDPTPKSIEIKGGIGGQTLTFVNKSAGGLELIKVSEGDKTKRIPNVTFEIRKMDGALVDTIRTDKQGRAHLDLDAGDFYAVEVECPKEFKLDSTPHYFTVKDGKTTTLTVTNKPLSEILIHKTDSMSGKGIQGVTFLLYDSTNTPIGQYVSDNSGYVRIEGLTTPGCYYLRELKNDGYVVDTELKTVYVKAGETTEVNWKNVPITGQIQILKKSADYNPTNGLPEGTLLPGAVFEIYDKANNVVDTIKSDSQGLAVSKPLPLGRYTIREVKAPDNYGVNDTVFNAYLEHKGQILTFEVTNKSLTTGVAITKTGPKEVMGGQPVRYMFSGIANTSNVMLTSFYWRDSLPAEVILDKIVTGTYNRPGNYKIVYRVNGGEYQTLADNLSTQKNYTLAASPVALGLASNERVTEIMFVFGQAPAGFAQVEKPYIYCNARPGLPAGFFVNKADVGGVYNGEWIQAVSRWVTTIYGKPTTLPRTGY